MRRVITVLRLVACSGALLFGSAALTFPQEIPIAGDPCEEDPYCLPDAPRDCSGGKPCDCSVCHSDKEFCCVLIE